MPHKQEIGGSNPSSATIEYEIHSNIYKTFPFLFLSVFVCDAIYVGEISAKLSDGLCAKQLLIILLSSLAWWKWNTLVV